MSGLKSNIPEALIGLVVVLFAGWFVWFAFQRTGGGAAGDSVRVTALFPNASGVNVGTEVRVAGLKVGVVAAQALDPKSYQVQTILAIDPKVALPSDSSAAITSEGLLGSTYVALVPGGSATPLRSGDQILDTQGAVDMMSMIGQFINRSGSETKPAAGAAPAP